MKNYNTLRPMQLDEAEVGDAIFSTFHDEVVTFISGPDITGRVCVEYKEMFTLVNSSKLKQNPICWVEDKPVYKGDKLQYTSPMNPSGAINIEIREIGYNCNEVFVVSGGCVYVKVIDLTWVLAKTKREGWVNIYPNNRAHPEIFKSKEDAEKSAYSTRITCIKIEWME